MGIQELLDKILELLNFIQSIFDALQRAIAEPKSAISILKEAFSSVVK